MRSHVCFASTGLNASPHVRSPAQHACVAGENKDRGDVDTPITGA